jgi:hypothetical protein
VLHRALARAAAQLALASHAAFAALALLTLSTLRLLSLQPQLAILGRSLWRGLSDVLHLAAVLGLVVAAYGVWGHVAFGAQAEDWASVRASAWTMARMFIAWDYSFAPMQQANPAAAAIFVGSFMFLVANMLVWIWFTVVIENYSLAKAALKEAAAGGGIVLAGGGGGGSAGGGGGGGDGVGGGSDGGGGGSGVRAMPSLADDVLAAFATALRAAHAAAAAPSLAAHLRAAWVRRRATARGHDLVVAALRDVAREFERGHGPAEAGLIERCAARLRVRAGGASIGAGGRDTALEALLAPLLRAYASCSDDPRLGLEAMLEEAVSAASATERGREGVLELRSVVGAS